jgi:hypothetical protein
LSLSLEIDFENVLIDQLFFSLFMFLGKQFDPLHVLQAFYAQFGSIRSGFLVTPIFDFFDLSRNRKSHFASIFELKCENALWIHSIETHVFLDFVDSGFCLKICSPCQNFTWTSFVDDPKSSQLVFSAFKKFQFRDNLMKKNRQKKTKNRKKLLVMIVCRKVEIFC